MMREFLPISRDDMKKRGWDELDFVYVIGDAYVDHPSFGPAIISRVLEAHGYKVGIISQPDWKNDQSVMALGVPRLGFLVSAGNMDSMVPQSSKAGFNTAHNDRYIRAGPADHITIDNRRIVRSFAVNAPRRKSVLMTPFL